MMKGFTSAALEFYLFNNDFVSYPLTRNIAQNSCNDTAISTIATLDLTQMNEEKRQQLVEIDVRKWNHETFQKQGHIICDGSGLLSKDRDCDKLRKRKSKSNIVSAQKIIARLLSKFTMQYNLNEIKNLKLTLVFGKCEYQDYDNIVNQRLQRCVGEQSNLIVCNEKISFSAWVLEKDVNNNYKHLSENTIIITSNRDLINDIKNINISNIKVIKSCPFYHKFLTSIKVETKLYNIVAAKGYQISKDTKYGTSYIIHKKEVVHAPFLLINANIEENELKKAKHSLDSIQPNMTLNDLSQRIIGAVRMAKCVKKTLVVMSTLCKTKLRLSKWEYDVKSQKYVVDWNFQL